MSGVSVGWILFVVVGRSTNSSSGSRDLVVSLLDQVGSKTPNRRQRFDCTIAQNELGPQSSCTLLEQPCWERVRITLLRRWVVDNGENIIDADLLKLGLFRRIVTYTGSSANAARISAVFLSITLWYWSAVKLDLFFDLLSPSNELTCCQTRRKLPEAELFAFPIWRCFATSKPSAVLQGNSPRFLARFVLPF